MIRRVILLLLLVLPLPGLGDDAKLAGSILLVARKDMPDPFFRESVVLVMQQPGGGPVGVIINKPTDIALAKVFPEFEGLRARPDRLFFGGPVRREGLVAVFRAPKAPEDALEMFDGVYMTGKRDILTNLVNKDKAVDGVRIFAGHAGWAPGQLENEIERGDWHVLRADSRTVFERKPETLWTELERRAAGTMI